MEKVLINRLNGCFFLNADDDLLEKYNTIWGKSNGDTKKKKRI